ncbi:hypothetical protein CR513_12503, partial [Mucuna pruriens]
MSNIQFQQNVICKHKLASWPLLLINYSPKVLDRFLLKLFLAHKQIEDCIINLNDHDTKVVVQQKNSTRIIPLPFPSRAAQERKFGIDDELLQTFSKLEINILLLDAIKQIPKYANFLKEICTNKRKKLKGDMEVGRSVSTLIKSKQVFAMIHPTMPNKCSKYNFDAILDLGVSINFMLSSIYRYLRLDALELTGIVIQLANNNTAYPLGILEDMLVQVSDMIFLADFYVLNMKDELSSKGPTLILGRPFLKTTRTKIDVHGGTLSMEFDDNKVEYNIFEAMKHPIENHSIFCLDVID